MEASTWFISAPANPTKEDAIQKLRDRISSSRTADIATIFPFTLPEFKVGSLDSLMLVSDELAKADILVETIVVRIADTLKLLVDSWSSMLLVHDRIFLLNKKRLKLHWPHSSGMQ